MLYLLLIGLIVFASLLMCFIVLIQNSKGGGLSSAFASSNQIMGVRKTTDFIEKATWGLAIVMVVLSVASAYVIPRAAADTSVIQQNALQDQATNPLNTKQGFGSSTTPDDGTATPAEAAPATSTESDNAETPAK